MKRIKGIGCDYVLMELKSIGGIWIHPTKDPMWNSGMAYEGKTGPDFGEWPPSGTLSRITTTSRICRKRLRAKAFTSWGVPGWASIRPQESHIRMDEA